MNNISIVGRITKDVQLQTASTNGAEYARFNVAVQGETKDADGKRKADFFTCIAWRETAKTIAKYFKKGNPIGIIGSMNSRSYQKEDGTTQNVWELNVKNFVFISTMEENEDGKSTKTNKETSTQMALTPVDDEDLPF